MHVEFISLPPQLPPQAEPPISLPRMLQSSSMSLLLSQLLPSISTQRPEASFRSQDPFTWKIRPCPCSAQIPQTAPISLRVKAKSFPWLVRPDVICPIPTTATWTSPPVPFCSHTSLPAPPETLQSLVWILPPGIHCANSPPPSMSLLKSHLLSKVTLTATCTPNLLHLALCVLFPQPTSPNTLQVTSLLYLLSVSLCWHVSPHRAETSLHRWS